MMLKTPELFPQGFYLTNFSLDPQIRELVHNQSWSELDRAFLELTASDGELFLFLKRFHDFSSVEFIISIRDAAQDWEEDGIWHDDGSRIFAFSLSLTLESIEGGKLGIRPKSEEGDFPLIETPPHGGIILFLTGHYGFEHRIHRVTRGVRVIIAGWCS
jgi:hypothetical protein